MVKIPNTCILSILVYNLFLDKQRNILYTLQYFHTSVYWLSSWNRNSNYRKYDLIGRKNRLDTKPQCFPWSWNVRHRKLSRCGARHSPWNTRGGISGLMCWGLKQCIYQENHLKFTKTTTCVKRPPSIKRPTETLREKRTIYIPSGLMY